MIAASAAVLAGQVVVAGPASAGTVGVTVSVQGAGSTIVVEGSVEGGADSTCDQRNQKDERVTVACSRFINEEAFEAWVWLRPTAASVPAGHWRFVEWQNCDQTRTGTTGAPECGVRSGAFSLDEKFPKAVFADDVAPTVSNVNANISTDVEKRVMYGFSVDESGTTQCRFDSEVNFTNCSNPTGKDFASEGSHTIYVRGVDPSGQAGSPVSYTVTVLDTAISGGPSGVVNSRTAFLGYNSFAGTGFECSLNFAAFTSCPTSGMSYVNLGDGEHTFRVRSVATGGWYDRIPAVRTWRVDATPPETTLGAPSSTTGSTVTWNFFHDGSGNGFDCRLITPANANPAWGACSGFGSHTVSGLSEGQHTFQVRAKDAAGNIDPTPASYTWTVDTTAPNTTVLSGPAHNAFVLSTAATLGFGSTEAGSTFACSLDGGGAACPGGSLSLTNLTHATHTVTSAATDGAANTDPTPARRTWTVPLSNTELTHGTGWTQRTATNTYLGSYSQATRKGSTLSRSVAGARKVALVATRGPNHGSVRVFAGNTLLKTIALNAATLQTRRVFPVTTFASPFTGNLRIVVSTAGRTVRIEGLGVATQ